MAWQEHDGHGGYSGAIVFLQWGCNDDTSRCSRYISVGPCFAFDKCLEQPCNPLVDFAMQCVLGTIIAGCPLAALLHR